MGQITTDAVKQFRAQRKVQVSKTTGDVPSNRTINAEIVSLRQLLIKHGLWAKVKGGSQLKRLPVRKSAGRFLTDEECLRLLAACKASGSRALYPAMMLSVLTGLRSVELRHLRWMDVHLDFGFLMVTVSKTESGERKVDLHAAAVKLLRDWRAQDPGARSSDYVFQARCHRFGVVKAAPTKVMSRLTSS